MAGGMWEELQEAVGVCVCVVESPLGLDGLI